MPCTVNLHSRLRELTQARIDMQLGCKACVRLCSYRTMTTPYANLAGLLIP